MLNPHFTRCLCGFLLHKLIFSSSKSFWTTNIVPNPFYDTHNFDFAKTRPNSLCVLCILNKIIAQKCWGKKRMKIKELQMTEHLQMEIKIGFFESGLSISICTFIFLCASFFCFVSSVTYSFCYTIFKCLTWKKNRSYNRWHRFGVYLLLLWTLCTFIVNL